MSEVQFRGFLEASPDAVIVVDQTGRINFASNRIEAMFGYLPNELVGKSLSVLMPERFRDLHHATEVNVMEVVEDGSEGVSARRRVDDVTAWLRRRGVSAFSMVVNARKDAEEIQAIWENGADVVVAGAYGHTRLRELVLGGVTRSLLTQSRHCSLLSH